jgi:hypothetical protein
MKEERSRKGFERERGRENGSFPVAEVVGTEGFQSAGPSLRAEQFNFPSSAPISVYEKEIKSLSRWIKTGTIARAVLMVIKSKK